MSTLSIALISIGAPIVYLFVAGITHVIAVRRGYDGDAAVVTPIFWPITLTVLLGISFARWLTRNKIPQAKVVSK